MKTGSKVNDNLDEINNLNIAELPIAQLPIVNLSSNEPVRKESFEIEMK